MARYSWEEIQKHSSEDDAWVVVNGNVYDVTSFASIHPGGKEFIVQHAGQNVTDLIKQEDVHIHSEAAYSLLEAYKIGQTVDNQEDDDDSFELKGWKEETVDWNQGLVVQVHKYGYDYLKWVHSPVNKQLRLFSTQFLEIFSITPWYLVPLVWLPVILIIAFRSYSTLETHMAPLQNALFLKFLVLCVLMVCGFCTWTLVEYLLHRFLFHLTPPGDSKFWITLHFFLHGQHHKVPFDPGRLVFPPVAAMGFALPFYFLFANIFPLAIGEGIYAGGLFGYLVYDMTHYYIHHGQPAPGSYLYRLKQYHLKHHFANQNLGFGISSTFWDRPFGTSPLKSD